jgi:hypothetical protein
MKKQLLLSFLGILLSVVCHGQPSVAAPTPTRNASLVKSIFSDAYTNVAANLNPNWGQATVVTQPLIAGNTTLLYTGLTYQGIELGSNQDVSGMGFLHLDYWTTNSTALNIYVISPGPVEKAYALAVPTTGWNSVDIPLSAFAPPVVLSNVFQFKFDGNGTIYLDNLYFYSETVLPAEDATLSDLRVSGTTVAGFVPSVLNYNVVLPIGTTVVPSVTATSTVVGAGVVITPAAALPGTSTVLVTSTSGTKTKTYSVAFTVAVPKPDLPITFENTTLNFYHLTDFGGNVSEIIVDPTNSGNHVVKTIKTAAAETWAGTTVGETIGFANKIPFTASATKMSVRVWSPTSGIPIRLKVEDVGDPTKSVETEALTTKVNTWETLVFDFTVGTTPPTAALNLAYNYTKASIFFNFGKTGADSGGEKIYYWDDMEFGTGTPTGIDFPNSAKNKVNIYPNPAEDVLYFTSKTAISKVAIYNVVGTQVKKYGNVSQSVDVNDLRSGVYIIRLTDTDGKTFSSKFIKK